MKRRTVLSETEIKYMYVCVCMERGLTCKTALVVEFFKGRETEEAFVVSA